MEDLRACLHLNREIRSPLLPPCVHRTCGRVTVTVGISDQLDTGPQPLHFSDSCHQRTAPRRWNAASSLLCHVKAVAQPPQLASEEELVQQKPQAASQYTSQNLPLHLVTRMHQRARYATLSCILLVSTASCDSPLLSYPLDCFRGSLPKVFACSGGRRLARAPATRIFTTC